jgi:hypothetical protein
VRPQAMTASLEQRTSPTKPNVGACRTGALGRWVSASLEPALLCWEAGVVFQDCGPICCSAGQMQTRRPHRLDAETENDQNHGRGASCSHRRRLLCLFPPTRSSVGGGIRAASGCCCKQFFPAPDRLVCRISGPHCRTSWQMLSFVPATAAALVAPQSPEIGQAALRWDGRAWSCLSCSSPFAANGQWLSRWAPLSADPRTSACWGLGLAWRVRG